MNGDKKNSEELSVTRNLENVNGLTSEQSFGFDFDRFHDADTSPQQFKINEFEVRRTLGRGGFGVVFLAFDTLLQREVALKIPHQSALNQSATIDLYLSEARAIAVLDHPNIVPVFKAGKSSSIPCYIVTKFVEGCNLHEWVNRNKPSYVQIGEIVGLIANALGYAHSRGVVHRDVKPGNILVDLTNRPYVADFGLALRDADPTLSPAYAGTPSYMSPEQARGEGHRVDGRSDIFSLGIVLYQLLAGKNPFSATSKKEILDAVQQLSPPPPHHVVSTVPIELSRICSAALEKSVFDRYQRADEFADELLSFARTSIDRPHSNIRIDSSAVSSVLDTGATARGDTTDPLYKTFNDGSTSTVMPKGLRPFDATDADFFLQLMPAPYDRFGLPQIIRFWKHKIETKDQSDSVSVGLVYGPSGCGKTSIIRAGVIPRVDPTIKNDLYRGYCNGN